MQVTVRTQSGVDVAPQASTPGITVYTTDGGKGTLHIPTTREEMRALLARRRELTGQLNSVTERRNGLLSQLSRITPGEGEDVVKHELAVLDTRVLQLETDLGAVGNQIAAAPPQLIAMAQEPVSSPPDDMFGAGVGAGAGTVFVLMSAFVYFMRRRWKKSRKSSPALPAGDSDRLERLEHGMEAIAIEVERISEGQRFVTKLLSESKGYESAPR